MNAPAAGKDPAGDDTVDDRAARAVTLEHIAHGRRRVLHDTPDRRGRILHDATHGGARVLDRFSDWGACVFDHASEIERRTGIRRGDGCGENDP
jgi:hypothetical protein